MIQLANAILSFLLAAVYALFGVTVFAVPMSSLAKEGYNAFVLMFGVVGTLLGLCSYYFGIRRLEGRLRNVTWNPVVIFVHDFLLHLVFVGTFMAGNEMVLQVTNAYLRSN